MKIGIIGAGTMGSALARALKGHDILMFDHNIDKIKALGVAQACPNIFEMGQEVDLLIFAIKPQSFKKLPQQKGLEEKLILSVMTGITIAQLKLVTQSERIVRCMPNLAVQVEAGVTGWTATNAVTDEERCTVKEILGKLGVEVELDKEDHLDIVTAISGSGPAYFFHLTELLTDAAEKTGLSKEQARLLVEGTLVSSAELMTKCDKSAQEWRHEIMVPAGTTEAAIRVFENEDFDHLVLKAVQAAYQRAKELGQ